MGICVVTGQAQHHHRTLVTPPVTNLPQAHHETPAFSPNRRTPPTTPLLALTSALWLAATPMAHADTGKLLLTGGVSTVEGAAGGGLSPWAVISTQATEGENGASGFVSRAVTGDYGLTPPSRSTTAWSSPSRAKTSTPSSPRSRWAAQAALAQSKPQPSDASACPTRW